jgi:hypothetical protein
MEGSNFMCLVERRGMDKPRITRSCYIPHSSLFSLPTEVGSQRDSRGLRRSDDRALHYNGEHCRLGETHGLKVRTCPLVGVSWTVGVGFPQEDCKRISYCIILDTSRGASLYIVHTDCHQDVLWASSINPTHQLRNQVSPLHSCSIQSVPILPPFVERIMQVLSHC